MSMTGVGVAEDFGTVVVGGDLGRGGLLRRLFGGATWTLLATRRFEEVRLTGARCVDVFVRFGGAAFAVSASSSFNASLASRTARLAAFFASLWVFFALLKRALASLDSRFAVSALRTASPALVLAAAIASGEGRVFME